MAGLALLLAACGGGAPPQDLALAGVSPDRPTVVQGQSVTLTLTFTSQNGFQGQVSLSVTEGGRTPSWLTLSPTSVTLNVPKGGQAQVSLQVQVAGNAPTGTHSLKLRAAYGDRTAERDLTLTVSAPSGGGVALPPPASGGSFPGTPPPAGPPSDGAALMGGDRLVRVVVTPATLTLRPGEERYLAVWAEDEAGNRYAGDASYLELRWAGPEGYRVDWAGPGRVRVEAPGVFTLEPLAVSVRRRDLAPGKTFLNGVATVLMVEYKPGVEVLPEGSVGFPVTYELDRGSLGARFGLFTREEWGRAFRLDQEQGLLIYPLLVREEAAPRVGQVVAGEGEASAVLGRVEEVVARRGGYALLAVRYLFPWEVYERYPTEVDLGSWMERGVLPFDLGEPPAVGGIQPQSGGEGQGCSWGTPKLGAELGGSLSLEIPYKCPSLLGKPVEVAGSITLAVTLGEMSFDPQGVKVSVSGSLSLSGEVSLGALRNRNTWSLGDLQAGRSGGWLFNWYRSVPIGAWSLGVEAGLAEFNALSLLEPNRDRGTHTLPEDLSLFSLGVRGGGSVGATYENGRFSPSARGEIRLFAKILGQELGVDLDDALLGFQVRSYRVGLASDLVGAGVVVGLGGGIQKALSWLAKLMGYNISSLGNEPLAGVSLTFYPAATELNYTYMTHKGALLAGYRGEEAAGGVGMSTGLKVRARLRSAIFAGEGLRNLVRYIPGVTGLEAGLTLTPLTYFNREAKTLPGSLGVQSSGNALRVSGTMNLRGTRPSEVRAHRVADVLQGRLEALASTPTSVASFLLEVPRPGGEACGALSPEERTAAIVARSDLDFMLPLPLGWTYLGQVDLCRQVSLEVPALRAFVGEEARGQGTARYAGQGEVQVGLVGQTVGVSPASLRFTEPGERAFEVSFTCTQEGSFVGRVVAREDSGGVLAQAPVTVTCLKDEDGDPRNNGSPDTFRILRFFGDPHLITPDGAAYDFHAAGEFWGSLEPMPFQLRFLPMPGNPEATYTAGVAARLGEARVEVYALYPGDWVGADLFLPQVPLRVLVEGLDATEELSRQGYLALPGDAYVTVARWGVTNRGRRPLEVHLVYPGENPRPALAVVADAMGTVRPLGVGMVSTRSLAGRPRGLMGNANGDPGDDFVTRDGTRLTPPLTFGQLYEVFGRSWEVREGERLFTTARPNLRYPAGPPVLDPERAREAEAFCGTIAEEYLRRACLLDAVVSGDAAGAARVAGEVAQGRQGTAGPTTPATLGARLGVSPTYLRLVGTGEGTFTLANPTGEGVAYRLRLQGEGPGVRVEGTALAPGDTTPEATLGAGASRQVRLGGICPAWDGTTHFYLLGVEERDAAEARSVLVEVSCEPFTLSLSPSALTVPQGSSGTTTLTLTPQGGFTGTVSLDLVDGSGNPVPGITLSPQSVTVSGGGPLTQALTVSVASSVPPGTYPLRVRGTSGSFSREADLTVTVSTYTGAYVYQVSSDGSVLVGGAFVGGYRKPMFWRINPASLSPGFYWLGAIAQQSTVLDTGVPGTPYGNVLGVTADGQVACGYGSVRADAFSGDRALAWDLTTSRPIPLPDHSAGGNVAYACTKSGSDVYIVGRVYPDFPRPTIWKNYTIWHQNTRVWGIFHDITPDASKFLGPVKGQPLII